MLRGTLDSTWKSWSNMPASPMKVTHGERRVYSFLIESKGWTIDQILAALSEARAKEGRGIHYVHLTATYGEGYIHETVSLMELSNEAYRFLMDRGGRSGRGGRTPDLLWVTFLGVFQSSEDIEPVSDQPNRFELPELV